MNHILLLLCISMVTALTVRADTTYTVEQGTRGNTLTLEIENHTSSGLTHLRIAVEAKPDWVEISRTMVSPESVEPKRSAIALVEFDVASVPISLRPGKVTIAILDVDRLLARKSITLTGLVPDRFHLHQNYPNPFNPKTKIQFRVARPSDEASSANSGRASSEFVELSIHDVLGRKVATLVNERKEPGSYQVEFDGKDLASGVYLYRLSAGTFVDVKKLLLLK